MHSRLRFAPAKRKLFAVLVCYSLLLTCIAPFALAHAKHSAAVRRTPQDGLAVAGAPEGVFPNLDEVRNGQLPQPVAPPSISSTIRSPRNPLAPRTVLHVGDPLPSPLPSPSLLPSASPVPTPLTSPFPSPSTSPLPSPPIPPLAARFARREGSTATTSWAKVINDKNIFQYLLAWNHSYPILSQSNHPALRPYGLIGSDTSSLIASWSPDANVSSNAAFDFFLLPMP